MKTTLCLRNGDLGVTDILVRADLADPASPIEINLCEGSGWETTGHQSAEAGGSEDRLNQIAKMLAAEACEMDSEEFTCDCLDADELDFHDRRQLGLVDPDIAAIARVLEDHGDSYAGNHVEDTATDWDDNGFRAYEVDDWCEIGCWDASTAAEWRDAGLSPSDVVDAAQSLIDDSDEPGDEWTSGCPIYSTCNRDTSTNVIITAYAALQPIEVEYHESHELLSGHWDTDEPQDQVDLADQWWEAFFEATSSDERLHRVRFVPVRGQRIILSQWQGYQWWGWSSRNLGTLGKLTDDEQRAIDEAESAALAAANRYYGEVILRDRAADKLRSEISAAVEAADLHCPEQVCDLVIEAVERGEDWRARLAECVRVDAVEAARNRD